MSQIKPAARPSPTPLPPAVVVRSPADLVEALDAAGGAPLTALSAPGAGCHGGAGWWTALVAAARAARPGAPFADVLDCADMAGRAMEALSAGAGGVVFDGHPAAAARLEAVAAHLGRRFLRERPPAMDPAGRRDRRAAVAAWLSPGGEPPPPDGGAGLRTGGASANQAPDSRPGDAGRDR
jgi:hypothetical protein